MAFISVSGEPGCRPDELARLVAGRLDCELANEPALETMIAREFGPDVPPKAWPDAATSALALLGTSRHVVICCPGAEMLFANLAGVLRIHVAASEARRAGHLMISGRLDRAEAKRLLKELKTAAAAMRRARFGSTGARAEYDLILNEAAFIPEQMLALVEAAAAQKGVLESGLLSPAAESQVQFQVRYRLAKFGLTPARASNAPKREFGHPSEEIFANLLDFYRVAWQYEPRSFPLQWDQEGKVIEAFTPDFYLPEFDLYVELTTMKQALVTRKNRKVRLLRAIYPHVNIQVFYQKDLQELVIKYGLAEKSVT